MKKCIVIGGGLAGLSTAVFLADKGINIELLEASPKLGGRTYSLKDQTTSDIIDNGQHILMGCYKETLDFIKTIKAEENFSFQKQLKVNFVKENFIQFPLKSGNSFYPINLLSALLNYKAVSLNDRLNLLKFFAKLHFYSNAFLSKLTVYQWLLLEKQSEDIIKSFWEILAVGALNTNIKKASAKIFADILKKIFFRGNKASTIIIPKSGLTESFCNNSKIIIEEKGGTVSLLEPVLDFELSGEKIKSIKTNKREISGFDFVVSAVPYFILKNIIKERKRILDNIDFQYSTIVTIHIWLVKNNLQDDFYGLINSQVHWVFNHSSHLTLVISDADNLINTPKEVLFDLAAGQLEKYLRIGKEEITSYKVIKEKRATFIPSADILGKRPDSGTILKNFFLAGDWINTGLPSTIESAVKSGKMAADLITK
jgi:hydroxysqualene dehydroxylase